MNTVSITDQVMRSLLQKAVRRGNTEMVNSVLHYFIQTGQDKWIRNRLAVITAVLHIITISLPQLLRIKMQQGWVVLR